MDWLKKITDQITNTAKQAKETLEPIGKEIMSKGDRIYKAIHPMLSPIPEEEERNPIKDIFNAIFKKEDEQTQPQVEQPLPEVKAAAVEAPTTEPVATPMPTPTPIIDITPQGETRMYGRNPNVKNYKIVDPVYSAINRAANEFQIPAALLFDIALQESSFDPTLVNDSSDAVDENGNPLNPTGLFQFTDETWEEILRMYNDKEGMSLHLPNTNRKDPYTNALATAYLIRNGQLGKWTASKGSWGVYWPEEELIDLGFYDQTLAYKLEHGTY